MKVGIIGCGKVADQHAGHIKYIKTGNLFAVCDKELLMAKQLSEAQVEGTAQNVSDKTLKNIVITYKIGRQSVTAEIASLKPNQKVKFVTTKHKTKKTAPQYKLESIKYTE